MLCDGFQNHLFILMNIIMYTLFMILWYIHQNIKQPRACSVQISVIYIIQNQQKRVGGKHTEFSLDGELFTGY